jgi:hypothetical protein
MNSEGQISIITQKLEKVIDNLDSIFTEIDKMGKTMYIEEDIYRLEYTINSSIIDLIDIINRKLGSDEK